MTVKFATLLVLACLSALTPLAAQQVRINEFLASNKTVNLDEDGDSSDWIELVNTGADSVSLRGMTLTDDAATPAQWIFPDVSLPPGGFLLVWASGKDRTTGTLHTNFKLSAAGEYVGLYSATGQLVDERHFGPQLQDVSEARFPDGSGVFAVTARPTPTAPNIREIPAAAAVTFEPSGGFYAGPVQVQFRSEISGAVVRYSVDGSTVTPGNPIAAGPITVSSTAVIRARAFVGGQPVGDDISQFYAINFPGRLPVLSLATDNDNLYGGSGLFDNPEKRGKAWERPVSVNFLELDGSGFRANAGLRVHGQSSRSYPKKSLRLYFRGEYGPTKLRYRLFDEKDLSEFDKLVIHSGGAVDQYFGSAKWTLLRDVLAHSLWSERGGAVSAHRPALVFLNGAFWGIYWLRERIDGDYLASNFGIQQSDLLEWALSETPLAREGSADDWNTLYDFIRKNDLGDAANYERVASEMDINQFIDYQIIEIFSSNVDWPHTNNLFFRERAPGARWRWILWDAEFTFRNPEQPLLEWATRDSLRPDISPRDKAAWLFAPVILRKLLQNAEFRLLFLNRFADFLNTTLTAAHVRQVFDALVTEIEPDIPLEAARWGTSTAKWYDGVASVRKFVGRRAAVQRRQLMDFFGLSGIAGITVAAAPGGAGSVRVNSVVNPELPWSGKYFTGVPLEIEARPNPGFVFSRWSGASADTTPVISIKPANDLALTAHFARVGGESPPIIFGFSPEAGEVGSSVLISGANFTDVTAVFFADAAAAFAVVADTLITATVPDSAATGRIRMVAHGDTTTSSSVFTVIDSAVTSVGGSGDDSNTPGTLRLRSAYPNPFNAEVTIAYELPAAARVRLAVYNLLGQRVRVLAEGLQAAGRHTVSWDGQNAGGRALGSGLYLIALRTESRVLVRKIILQK